jgi:hypothetical protein
LYVGLVGAGGGGVLTLADVQLASVDTVKQLLLLRRTKYKFYAFFQIILLRGCFQYQS